MTSVANTAAWTPWGKHPLAANDNQPRVVAFTGVAGSGKSTAADYLTSKGYTRVKFAGPLKAAMRALGLSDAHIEGDLKESPCALLCGKTPRYAMQTLGTQWGRDLLGEDFWIGLWRAAANDVMEAGGRVVTDDCRFPNEAAAVRRMGGDIYRLVGRGGIGGQHESERMEFEADALIENDGGREELRARVDEVMGRYG